MKQMMMTNFYFGNMIWIWKGGKEITKYDAVVLNISQHCSSIMWALFSSGHAQHEPCTTNPVNIFFHLALRRTGGVSSAAGQLWKMASGEDKGGPEFQDVPAASFLSAVGNYVQALCNTCCLCWQQHLRYVGSTAETSPQSVTTDRARRRESGRKEQLL